MRSWIFVIGAAAMGVASVIGFSVSTARLSQRVEVVAENPGSRGSAPPLAKLQWARLSHDEALLRCASCHADRGRSVCSCRARRSPRF